MEIIRRRAIRWTLPERRASVRIGKVSKYICIFALIIADSAAIRGVTLGPLGDYLVLFGLM